MQEIQYTTPAPHGPPLEPSQLRNQKQTHSPQALTDLQTCTKGPNVRSMRDLSSPPSASFSYLLLPSTPRRTYPRPTPSSLAHRFPEQTGGGRHGRRPLSILGGSLGRPGYHPKETEMGVNLI